MEGKGMRAKFWSENVQERDHGEYKGIYERIILTELQKQDGSG
jgi:hypothetical protein